MEENMLKTSWKQRLIIILVAVVLLGSSMAVYVAIVLGNGNSSSSKNNNIEAIQKEYDEKNTEYEARASEVSKKYFDEFLSYRSSVKAYNAETVNSGSVSHTDLKEGTGETITPDSDNYSAYYIGFCANEEVFDSSFDNYENPTTLKAPLEVQPDYLIEGWYLGVDGMKIGGVREIAIAGSLAYGDSQEICGGLSSPLKFIIMAVEKDAELSKLNSELEEISSRYMEAYYSSLSTEEDASEEDDSTEASDDSEGSEESGE